MKKFLLVFVSLFILIPNVEAKTLGELKKELENFELEQKEAEYNRQLTQDQLNKNYASMADANKKISEINSERKQLNEDIENLNNEKEINQNLLDEIGENFKSTFKYEKDTIKTEEKQTKGDKVTWKENKDKAQTQYILVESDTIIGHYTYEYETVTAISDDGNTRITKKKYKTETLQGEQYERLKDYLKTSMNLNNEDIDMCVDLVINSSGGYYDDTINNAYTILIGNDMFTWPIPGYTNVTSEYGYRVHPISRRI